MKQFDSIEAVLKDPKCASFIQQSIYSVLKERQKIRDNGNRNIRFKRTPFDSLSDKGMLNPRHLIYEAKLISFKRSDLPAQERLLVAKLVDDALVKTIVFYEQKKEEQK